MNYVPGLSAVIAAAVSALSGVVLGVWLQNKTRREKLLPVIVFYRRPSLVWILKNVGEGTALSVFVRNYGNGGQLLDEVELYPVTPGEEISLDYLKGADKLIAVYVNIFGQERHHTICSKNANKVSKGKPKEEKGAEFSKGHESNPAKWPVTRLP